MDDSVLIGGGITVVLAMVGLLWKVNASSESRSKELHSRVNDERKERTSAISEVDRRVTSEREERALAITEVHKTLHGYVHKDVVLQLIDAQFKAQDSKFDTLSEQMNGITRRLDEGRR